ARRDREADARRDARHAGAAVHPHAAGLGRLAPLDRLQACAAQRRDPGRHDPRARLRGDPGRHRDRRVGVRDPGPRRARGAGDAAARRAADPRDHRLLHRDRDRRQRAGRPRLRLARPAGARLVSALIESTAAEPAAVGQPRFLRRLLRRPVAIATLAFLAALVVACLLAPLIAPYDAGEQDLTRVLTGPTAHNLLGTDTLGRDVLSRLLHGGLRSVRSVVEGVAVVLALGVPL